MSPIDMILPDFKASYHPVLAVFHYEKAVLATLVAETNAYGMYRKRDCKGLLEEIFFPGVPRPYRIIGLELAGFS